MNLLFWTIYILLTLFIGSFLNVVALRIPKNESIIYPPSHCPSCQHRLSVLDLIPVLSYIGLKGKCRYCRVKISPIYPLGELLTLVLFFLIQFSFGFSKELIIAYPFAMIMIAATLSDLKYQVIPNRITYFGIALFLILRFWIHPLSIWNYWIGAVLGGGLLLLIAILSRGGMGGGDIKLFFLIGLVLGWQNTLLALFLSTGIGAVIGGILMLLGVVKQKQLIPFGPFIFIGTMITYFLGNQIWQWYLGLY
ncbi:A24 family peptidase [Tepidibacillus infernus]